MIQNNNSNIDQNSFMVSIIENCSNRDTIILDKISDTIYTPIINFCDQNNICVNSDNSDTNSATIMITVKYINTLLGTKYNSQRNICFCIIK